MQAFLVKKKLSILKFGGSSLGNKDLIKKAAEKVLSYSRDKNVVVVVSAMFGVTNELIKKVDSIGIQFNDYCKDLIITSGESFSAAVFSAYLNNLGGNSLPLCSWQIPIKVSNQNIVEINKLTIEKLLFNNIIPVITGFQGVDESNFVCSLKRGGSDTTATALASALEADNCIIYTDTDGVYEISPKLVDWTKNHHIAEISYEDMYDLALNGASIMSSDSILFAKEKNILIKVVSSFENENNIMKSTLIKATNKRISSLLLSRNQDDTYKIYCKLKKIDKNKTKIIDNLLSDIKDKSISESGFDFHIKELNRPILEKLLYLFQNQLRR